MVSGPGSIYHRVPTVPRVPTHEAGPNTRTIKKNPGPGGSPERGAFELKERRSKEAKGSELGGSKTLLRPRCDQASLLNMFKLV